MNKERKSAIIENLTQKRPAAELLNKRFWVWWKSRYAWFTGQHRQTDEGFEFELEDVCDVRFWITEEQVGQLDEGWKFMKSQITTGDRFGWRDHHFIYFTGDTDGDMWKFEDKTGREVWINEKDLDELERR